MAQLEIILAWIIVLTIYTIFMAIYGTVQAIWFVWRVGLGLFAVACLCVLVLIEPDEVGLDEK